MPEVFGSSLHAEALAFEWSAHELKCAWLQCVNYSVAQLDLSSSFVSAIRIAESTGTWQDDALDGNVGYADKAEIVAYDMLVRWICTSVVTGFDGHGVTPPPPLAVWRLPSNSISFRLHRSSLCDVYIDRAAGNLQRNNTAPGH